MKATCKALLISLITAGALIAHAGGPPTTPPPGWQGPGPYSHFHQHEHPQHRLAYWYAGETMRQSDAARQMTCGFSGQRWALDWEVHYRWALRANPNRIYRQVEERDRHLARCRSNKLREQRRPPRGRP